MTVTYCKLHEISRSHGSARSDYILLRIHKVLYMSPTYSGLAAAKHLYLTLSTTLSAVTFQTTEVLKRSISIQTKQNTQCLRLVMLTHNTVFP
jgi:hypothetical protein